MYAMAATLTMTVEGGNKVTIKGDMSLTKAKVPLKSCEASLGPLVTIVDS